MIRFLASFATAILLIMPALAQKLPVYAKMGTIEITLDDERMLHYTTSNSVPNVPTVR